MKNYIILILSSFFSIALNAQEKMPQDTSKTTGYVVPMQQVDGEWVPHVNLRRITILPPVQFANAAQQRRYTKMEYNVKKVYPYAQKIQQIFVEVTTSLDTLKNKKAQKAYIEKREAELKVEFEDKLKKLTYTQGRILIKLVDRQTGTTTYEVVRRLKGSVTAFFWQSVARVFGSNLKAEYNATGDDWMIEDIITRIENGQL